MRRFPEGFLFGTATSATQVEGSQPDSDWAAWAREPGHVKDGVHPDDCGDHWNDFTRHIELAQEIGLNAHRLSLDWARIEPRPGEIDHAALDRYRAELGGWRDAGILPMVTLHHFSFPAWLEGGVLNEELPARMGNYAQVCAEALGDLAHLWVTINEPSILPTMGYIFGEWVPGKSGRVGLAVKANLAFVEAHVRMYRALKASTPDIPVGLAHHLRIFEPRDIHKRMDRACARTLDQFFNQSIVKRLLHGRFVPGYDQLQRSRTGFDLSDAVGTQDFFGINYYSRDLVRFTSNAKEGFVDRHIPRGAEVTDLGWEVYPEGLADVLRRWWDEAGLPIYVTENGIADERDRQRPNFLIRHLLACLDAVETGVDLRGYFHWSLVDNFEWAEGLQGRFGLYGRDEDGAFKRRKSAELYRRVIEDGGIGKELRVKYGGPATSARRQGKSA
jgi:beta-glucosidase